MKIDVLFGVEGAKSAKGITVIIDVFRAASTAAYILNREAKYIIPVSDPKEAFRLKENNPDYILVGEERGIIIEGFDIGNSPYEINKNDLKNKIVVFRTSQGTQGIVNAENADEIIFGSFPQAGAIVEYIQNKKPEIVSLVSMGGIAEINKAGKGGEDDKFAEYIKARLLNESAEIDLIIKYLKEHECSNRFLDPNIPEFPSEDFALCLAADIYNFVPKVEALNDRVIIKKF